MGWGTGNIGGGGAGLNLKVINGDKPLFGDTLIWDCDTTGLITVGGTFAKVSDITPSLADLSMGGSIYLYSGGYLGETMTLTVAEVSPGVLFVSEAGFVILEDGLEYGGMVFPEAGIYLPTNSGADEIVVQIKGYTGFDVTPAKENTLLVNTDTPISGYAFSAEPPANRTEGMVWIKTASESTTPINVDKKNTVLLYPQAVWQFIGGLFEGKTAQVYTDGAWHELWDGYYYKLGEYYEGITGGYASTVSDNTGGNNNGLLTFNSNNMVLSPRNTGTQGGNMATSVKAIDVTDVNTLVFDCFADDNDACSVGVTTQKGVWGGAVASTKVTNTARANVSVDVSRVTGEVYILLKAWWSPTTSKGKLTVYNIYKQ